MPPKFQTHRLEFPPDHAGKRLDQALARLLPQYSRSRIQKWIEEGAVLVNGLTVKARDMVVGGEVATVEARLPVETGIKAEKLPLDIVHQDSAVIILNKPPGVVVHPGAGNPGKTLQNALLAHDPKLKRVPRAGLVHRIDKDTSGLLVVARTVEAQAALVAELGEHDIEREYLAVCTGAMTGGGTVDKPLDRHRSHRLKFAVRSDGREAVTHYRIEKRFRQHTLVRVRLETGRTHQIRVHMEHIGYPVVGDPLYAGRKRFPKGATPELREALEKFPRQALHAAKLELTHPKTGKRVTYEAPLPDDMKKLLDMLTRDAAEHAG
ncbi:MAG TPA: 23S rRNA pseudouridine(1911/1915/1917) synthase RluD [Steroidobacteraceae bacterium]|nr:23S rRNA pseudouridine(1911/1915/1917) synthase RluD [Steroidobacteraceae bacterium]